MTCTKDYSWGLLNGGGGGYGNEIQGGAPFSRMNGEGEWSPPQRLQSTYIPNRRNNRERRFRLDPFWISPKAVGADPHGLAGW